MKMHTFDSTGENKLKSEEAIPECGEDFCDHCGDCLHCYGGDPCTQSKDGEHYWIEYSDDV